MDSSRLSQPRVWLVWQRPKGPAPDHSASSGSGAIALGLLVISYPSRLQPPVESRRTEDRPMQDVIDIGITPLSAACGAEIKGNLTRLLSDEMVRAIKGAWARHLMLVFRGQTLSQQTTGFVLRPISAFWAIERGRRSRSATAPKESSRTIRKFSSSPTSRWMASRSGRSARANSGLRTTCPVGRVSIPQSAQ
jgi:hypothetical protein